MIVFLWFTFFPFLLLFFPIAFAPGPSRENKLFIECAVRAPKGRHGPETVVSHSKMSKDRIILFGLGGNLYVGNSELSDLCKEDKEFGGTSRMAPTVTQAPAVYKCANGKLTLNGGEHLTLTNKNQGDYVQCFAGKYELFECPADICGGKNVLFLVSKRHEPKAKAYSFVYGGQMLVREVRMANVSDGQLDCVKRECAGEDSVPLVEETVRWRRKNRGTIGDQQTLQRQGDEAKFKVYKECAVKRRRVGTDGRQFSRMETLMAHVKMDSLVLFFGMGGNLYAGDSILAGECEEDKLFRRSRVTAMRATLLGCHKPNAENGTQARLTLRKSWHKKSNGKLNTGIDQIKMVLKTDSEAKGSQCHALETNHETGENGKQEHGQYDIYKCPREECAGRDRLLLISKKSKGKLVSGGQLLADQVLFADMTPKQWQCMRQICGQNVRIPSVEAVKRKMDKSTRRNGTQRKPGRNGTKRMGRKGQGDKEGATPKRTQSEDGVEERKSGSDQLHQPKK